MTGLRARSSRLQRLRRPRSVRASPQIERILANAFEGAELAESDIVRLFAARGAQFEAVCSAADELRKRTVGDVVRYVVNRNINYTNVCSFRCQFCAFSKGKLSENLRGLPYDLDARRGRAARTGSLGARRDRSVHARRHPSRLHR